MSSLKRIQWRCSLQFWPPRQKNLNKNSKKVFQACKVMKRQFFQVRTSFKKMNPSTLGMQFWQPRQKIFEKLTKEFLPMFQSDKKTWKGFSSTYSNWHVHSSIDKLARYFSKIFKSFLSSLKLFMKNIFSKTFFSTKSSYGLVNSSFHNPTEKSPNKSEKFKSEIFFEEEFIPQKHLMDW